MCKTFEMTFLLNNQQKLQCQSKGVPIVTSIVCSPFEANVQKKQNLLQR